MKTCMLAEVCEAGKSASNRVFEDKLNKGVDEHFSKFFGRFCRHSTPAGPAKRKGRILDCGGAAQNGSGRKRRRHMDARFVRTTYARKHGGSDREAMDRKPAPFVPPAPRPRKTPPSTLETIRIVYRNPL